MSPDEHMAAFTAYVAGHARRRRPLSPYGHSRPAQGRRRLPRRGDVADRRGVRRLPARPRRRLPATARQPTAQEPHATDDLHRLPPRIRAIDRKREDRRRKHPRSSVESGGTRDAGPACRGRARGVGARASRSLRRHPRSVRAEAAAARGARGPRPGLGRRAAAARRDHHGRHTAERTGASRRRDREGSRDLHARRVHDRRHGRRRRPAARTPTRTARRRRADWPLGASYLHRPGELRGTRDHARNRPALGARNAHRAPRARTTRRGDCPARRFRVT